MSKPKQKSQDQKQKKFAFSSPRKEDFLYNPPQPKDLGSLSVKVLQLNARARKWLRAHQIDNLEKLVEAKRGKLISRLCLDSQVRKELSQELRLYWDGKKYKYILALNFLDRGVEDILSHRKTRMAPLKRLSLSPALQEVLENKKIQTVGELLLQSELKWRNPRMLGNILVNEILIALSTFITQQQQTS